MRRMGADRLLFGLSIPYPGVITPNKEMVLLLNTILLSTMS